MAERRRREPSIKGRREKVLQLTKLMTNSARREEKPKHPDVAETVPNLPIIEFMIDEPAPIIRGAGETDRGSRSAVASR